ncbi:MAG: carboxypeptidase-like regulatory domain-containing protein, partial [Bacteroidales bacterium]|nr:carboxypeptidase-like regulatory domain-containing protein [Bacteroidales bacterium]
MSKKLVSIVILFFFCIQLSGLAQEKITVSGSVYDNGTKEPLPFATVAVLGTYLGVATNEDGEFILSLPSILAHEILEISFVGYSPITISVKKAMAGPQIIFLKALDVTVGEVLVKSRRISGREILE